MKERRRRSRKTVGSLEPNTRPRHQPSPPPSYSLFGSVTQVQKNPHKRVFPWHGERRETGQSETE